MTDMTGLIIFGDSTLAGTGASDREFGCAKLVKSALKMPVSLRARNWNTSRDGLDRLEEDVIKQSQFSHVLILFGNNDGWLIGPGQPKVPLEEFRRNLLEIVSRIKNSDQFPLLCNLQPIDQVTLMRQFPELDEYRKYMELTAEQTHLQYSNAIEEVANKSGVDLIDIRSKLKNSPEKYIAEDGIHPNDKGHKMIANAIMQYLYQLDTTLRVADESIQQRQE